MQRVRMALGFATAAVNPLGHRVPVADQLEREVAADEMLEELKENTWKCWKTGEKTNACRTETARDALILFDTICQLRQDRRKLSRFDHIQLAALRTLQPQFQSLFDTLCPDFAQNVKLETAKFKETYNPSPEELEGVKKILWDNDVLDFVHVFGVVDQK